MSRSLFSSRSCGFLVLAPMLLFAIPGLFAAGELVGGLYYFNYPGSTGLMAGAVFGRIAGREAAVHALSHAATASEASAA